MSAPFHFKEDLSMRSNSSRNSINPRPYNPSWDTQISGLQQTKNRKAKEALNTTYRRHSCAPQCRNMRKDPSQSRLFYGAPIGIRTQGLPLRSTENRLIHAVLRCYAVFLKPLKYKAFRRIPCFSVSPDFVPFFRLFWRPVSKMLAEPERETNTNELWFVAELTFLTF